MTILISPYKALIHGNPNHFDVVKYCKDLEVERDHLAVVNMALVEALAWCLESEKGIEVEAVASARAAIALAEVKS